MDFATSLPAHVRFKPSKNSTCGVHESHTASLAYIQSASGSGSTHKLSAARKPVAEDNDFGHSDGNQAFLNVTFVDPAHARFDSEYNKVSLRRRSQLKNSKSAVLNCGEKLLLQGDACNMQKDIEIPIISHSLKFKRGTHLN